MSYSSNLDDPTVEEVCQVLHLGDYLVTFQKEELTFSDLLLLSENDFANLGLPMGPRKRLLTYLRDLEIRRAKLKQVRLLLQHANRYIVLRHFRPLQSRGLGAHC